MKKSNIIVNLSLIFLFFLMLQCLTFVSDTGMNLEKNKSIDHTIKFENPITISEANILENQDDFLSGSMENLTINKAGELLLNESNIYNWTNRTLTNKPSPREGSCMVFDSVHEVAVLFGGYDSTNDDETWMYNLTDNTWTQKFPGSKPSARYAHAMAYDSAHDCAILFGGYDGTRDDETWVYNLTDNTWTQKFPGSKPSARYEHTMVFDSAHEVAVLFGGNDGTFDDETWMYNLTDNTWTQKFPGSKPSARYLYAMAYDSTHDCAILFGGYDSGGRDDETWVYNLTDNTWTQKFPSSKPSARGELLMTYDSIHEVTILFGGNDGFYDDETWVYNLTDNTWTQKFPGSKPSARFGYALTYDSIHDVGILFGGSDSSGRDDETWTFRDKEYLKAGQYDSQTYDLNYIYQIDGNITWSPLVQPTETTLQFQIGISNTTSEMDFIYSPLSDTNFDFEGTGRYLKYRAFFTSDEAFRCSTPRVKEVNISYSLELLKTTLEIKAPNNNDDVSGKVLLNASAESIYGIENVSFYIDGSLIECDTTFPYEYYWDSNTTVNGPHTLTVNATSPLHTVSTKSISINVKNPPGAFDLYANLEEIPDMDGAFDLNWTESLEADFYRVYWDDDPITVIGTGNLYATDVLTNYTRVSGFASGDYYFAVVANNTYGETLCSSNVFVSVEYPPGSFNLYATLGEDPDMDGAFDLNWSKSTDAHYYEVYWDEDPITIVGEGTLYATNVLTNYTRASGFSSGDYYFAAVANNTNGEILCTSNVFVRIRIPPAPFTLDSNSTDPQTQGMFLLNWTKSVGAVNYTVYESNETITEVNSDLNIIASDILIENYTIHTFKGIHYYSILARNATGNRLSNCIEVNVQITPLSFVLSSDADDPDDDGEFTLTWSQSLGADNYTIYMYTNGNPSIIVNGTKALSKLISGLDYGTYSFVVKAHNEFGNTSSNDITIEVKFSEKSSDKKEEEPTSIMDQLIDTILSPFGLISIGAIISIVSIIVVKKKRRINSSRKGIHTIEKKTSN